MHRYRFAAADRRSFGPAARFGVVAFVLACLPFVAWATPSFTEVAGSVGAQVNHSHTSGVFFVEDLHISGGVGVGDYDGDGWDDLYVVRGDAGTNQLLRNKGDGTFEDRAADAGVDITGETSSSPAFADMDGDGDLDLIVPGVRFSLTVLFRNRGDGTFEDVTADAGFDPDRDVFSVAFGDYDLDGDLDMAPAHWNTPVGAGVSAEILLRNDGNMHFTDVSLEAGLTESILGGEGQVQDFSFSPNFADIDRDGWPDLLIAGDFGESRVFRNNGDGTFADLTDGLVITDENGMGAAVGDYDGDGILDWFVSSIWDPDGFPNGNWGITGNRLYLGVGDGTFVDATTSAGVRYGYWGWGSVAADLDNDRDLDIFHVNGWGVSTDLDHAEFYMDPARLYLNDGNAVFTEASVAAGAVSTGLGRGVVQWDYDHDGDRDLYVTNNGGPTELFQNQGNANHWLTIRIDGQAPNTQGVGAAIRATSASGTQFREMRASANFASQNPVEAHFGLGGDTSVSTLEVIWPRGGRTVMSGVAVDQRLVLSEPPVLCGNGVVDNGPGYAEECDEGARNGIATACCQANCLLRGDAVDVDSDGVRDTCDPCANPSPAGIDRARVRASGTATVEADDWVRLDGDLDFTGGPAPALDPATGVLRVTLASEAARATPLVDLAVPAGLYHPSTRSGWIERNGVWRFRGRDREDGLRSARLSVRPDGRIRFRVRQRPGSFAVDAGDLPLRMTVTLDGPFSSAGCGEILLDGLSDRPSCDFGQMGRRFACR